MSAEVRICSVWATVNFDGQPVNPVCVEEVPVSPEHAHQLAEAPEVTVEVAAASSTLGGRMIATRWLIGALGFIEAEAIDAYTAAVDELRLNPSAHQPWSAAA